MSVALQIRDVPEEVRDALAERARATGRSLQADLLALVEAEARRSRNARLLAGLDDRDDGWQPGPGETAAAVAAARQAREQHLAGSEQSEPS